MALRRYARPPNRFAGPGASRTPRKVESKKKVRSKISEPVFYSVTDKWSYDY